MVAERTNCEKSKQNPQFRNQISKKKRKKEILTELIAAKHNYIIIQTLRFDLIPNPQFCQKPNNYENEKNRFGISKLSEQLTLESEKFSNKKNALSPIKSCAATKPSFKQRQKRTEPPSDRSTAPSEEDEDEDEDEEEEEKWE